MSVTLDKGQAEAINEAGNVVITAGPGSGKTLTLTHMIGHSTRELLSYQGIIAISYTNKASNELRDRCVRMGINRALSYFGTIDSFCLSEIIAPFFDRIGRPWAEITILEDMECADWKELDGLDIYDLRVRKYLNDSVKTGKVPIGAICPIALHAFDKIEHVRKYIRARYTCIFVDEYQDCSLYQHQLFLRLVSLGLRGVAVGDADQAIYRFMHKVPDYLLTLIDNKGFKTVRMTENHRCDPSIRAYANALLFGERSEIAPANRRVFAIDVSGDETMIARAIHDHLESLMNVCDTTSRNEVAIIGRNHATIQRVVNNLGMAYKYFRKPPLYNGYSRWKRLFNDLLLAYYDEAQYAGSFLDRHIGIDAKPSLRRACFEYLDEFFNTDEYDLVNKTGLLKSIATIIEPDMERDGDTEAFVKTVEDVNVLRNAYEPARSDEINVLTYHGAKGLEFDMVFLLDTYQYIMPRSPRQNDNYDVKAEALALHYVGITRARKACFMMFGCTRHNWEGIEYPAIRSEFLSRNGVEQLRREWKF